MATISTLTNFDLEISLCLSTSNYSVSNLSKRKLLDNDRTGGEKMPTSSKDLIPGSRWNSGLGSSEHIPKSSIAYEVDDINERRASDTAILKMNQQISKKNQTRTRRTFKGRRRTEKISIVPVRTRSRAIKTDHIDVTIANEEQKPHLPTRKLSSNLSALARKKEKLQGINNDGDNNISYRPNFRRNRRTFSRINYADVTDSKSSDEIGNGIKTQNCRIPSRIRSNDELKNYRLRNKNQYDDMFSLIDDTNEEARAYTLSSEMKKMLFSKRKSFSTFERKNRAGITNSNSSNIRDRIGNGSILKRNCRLPSRKLSNDGLMEYCFKKKNSK